ncbi:hypothetical protein J6TS7_17540 [Paenibacillus dendritiformis]|nr:hypothetical protein J6TS7_17540 [Paenibacillus dendritiformis]
MENDFKPVVGYRFQFRTQPNEWWDGIIEGEVLIVDAPNCLSYTWASAGEKHTVTWTLEDLGDGNGRYSAQAGADNRALVRLFGDEGIGLNTMYPSLNSFQL